MRTVTLAGAHIKVYLNNRQYKEVQSISYVADYGEQEQYGIDAAFPQSIDPGQTSIRGTISGVRVRFSGGLQAYSGRPLYKDNMAGNYISIRVEDRSTGEDILFVQRAKVSRESHQVETKKTYRLSFDFLGQIPFFALDRA